VLDRFESLGCNSADLQADMLFQRLSTSVPGLCPPNAAWVVNQQPGHARVTLYLRDDPQVLDLVSTINPVAEQLFPGTQPRISARVSYHPKEANGRIQYGKQVHIPLTDPQPAAPKQTHARTWASLPSPTASASSLPSGSWAALVLNGGKRIAESAALNHRPRKHAKPQDSHARGGSPSAGSPPSAASKPHQQHKQQNKPHGQLQPATTPVASKAAASAALPVVDFQQSTAWKDMLARSAALEQRLEQMQTASSAMFATMTRQMESLTALVENQQRDTMASFTRSLDTIVAQLTARLETQFHALTAGFSQQFTTMQADMNAQLHSQLTAISRAGPPLRPTSALSVAGRPSTSASSSSPGQPHSPQSLTSASATPATNGAAVSHV